MAFAIGKAEKKSIFGQENEFPGPGTYQKAKGDFDLITQLCAPFNTSEVKGSPFNVPQTNYGPGSYNTVYPSDISKSSGAQKSHVFASRVERFKTETRHEECRQLSQNGLQTTFYSMSPQKKDKAEKQESYQQKLERSKDALNGIRQMNNKNKVESIKGKRQFIRVILTSSNNSENLQSHYIEKNITAKGIGPGSYLNSDYKTKTIKNGGKWENNRVQRFKSDTTLAPGPGAYYSQEEEVRKREKPSSAFASTQIRSHMDSIIYKTNIPIKAAILSDNQIKDNDPGPGSYNLQFWNQSKKSFNYGALTNFSMCERESMGKEGLRAPGPGYYEARMSDNVSNKNQLIKEIRNQIFIKPKNKKAQMKSEKKNPIDQNLIQENQDRKNRNKSRKQIYSLEERCFSKFGNMNQAERFSKREADRKPGPGEYLEDDFGLKRGHSAVFNSGTIRDVFEVREEPAPFYNIIRNDIGFKAEKMKKYIDNLRKINIVKTPFQTSTKRFIDPKPDAPVSFSKDIVRKTPRNVEKKKQESSAFKSGSKREAFKSEPKPGPGDYDVHVTSKGNFDDLEKKSFNKNYNYNATRHGRRPSLKVDKSKTTLEKK